jgi:hypothetical protein
VIERSARNPLCIGSSAAKRIENKGHGQQPIKIGLTNMYSNFLLGTLRVSRAAKKKLKRVPYDLIARHAVNEHGTLTQKENVANLTAMKTVGSIMSRYMIDPTDKSKGNVVVITRVAWDETLVRLETES